MTLFAGGFLALDNTDTWVLAAFILFISLLAYLGAFNFIGRKLDDRAAEIRRQLENARKLREEAQRKLASIERRKQEAEREVETIVANATRDAEAAAETARAQIAASVEQRIKSAEDQIALAEANAVRRVRDAAVDAAVAASAEVLRGSVQGDAASGMIDAAIKDVASRAN